jgi:hypothetical protein
LKNSVELNDLKDQLFKNFDGLNESERQAIVQRLNGKLPFRTENSLWVSSTLQKENFEFEFLVERSDPNLKRVHLNTVCPMYNSGEVSKTMTFSFVLKDKNSSLLQKISANFNECQ